MLAFELAVELAVELDWELSHSAASLALLWVWVTASVWDFSMVVYQWRGKNLECSSDDMMAKLTAELREMHLECLLVRPKAVQMDVWREKNLECSMEMMMQKQ